MSDILPNAHVSSLRTIRFNLDLTRMYTASDPTQTVTNLTTKLNPHGMTVRLRSMVSFAQNDLVFSDTRKSVFPLEQTISEHTARRKPTVSENTAIGK